MILWRYRKAEAEVASFARRGFYTADEVGTWGCQQSRVRVERSGSEREREALCDPILFEALELHKEHAWHTILDCKWGDSGCGWQVTDEVKIRAHGKTFGVCRR